MENEIQDLIYFQKKLKFIKYKVKNKFNIETVTNGI